MHVGGESYVGRIDAVRPGLTLVAPSGEKGQEGGPSLERKRQIRRRRHRLSRSKCPQSAPHKAFLSWAVRGGYMRHGSRAWVG